MQYFMITIKAKYLIKLTIDRHTFAEYIRLLRYKRVVHKLTIQFTSI